MNNCCLQRELCTVENNRMLHAHCILLTKKKKLKNLFCSQQDLQTIDLDEFKYSGTNITAFRLVDPENSLVHRTVSEWSQSELRSDKKPNERVFQVNSQFSTFFSLNFIHRYFFTIPFRTPFIIRIHFFVSFFSLFVFSSIFFLDSAIIQS